MCQVCLDTGSTRKWYLRHPIVGHLLLRCRQREYGHEWVAIATSAYVSTSGRCVFVTTPKKIGITIVKQVPVRVKNKRLYMALWIQTVFAFRFDHK